MLIQLTLWGLCPQDCAQDLAFSPGKQQTSKTNKKKKKKKRKKSFSFESV
uniref:Uncharacterized protein n=1 Tax=Anguilla anguilla TaxID=7936 RepID=A0A0E9QPB9_ANGAN